MDHDFGKHLQKARTDRGLSIEQAAAAVRIRSTFLRSLENSDLTKFPNAAYAKSFLLMYGRFLGVDLTSIAAQIDTTTQMKVEGYQYLTNRAAEQPKTKAEPELTFSAAPPPKTSGSWLPLLVLGGTLVVVVIGFIVWSNMNRLGERAPLPPQRDTEPAGPGSSVEPLAKVPAPTPVPTNLPRGNEVAPPRPAVISTPANDGAQAAPGEPEIPRARPISPVARLAATDSELLADLSPPKPRIVSRGPAVPASSAVSLGAEEENNTQQANANTTVLEPQRKTWVVIRTGPGGQALFEDYLYPAAKPLRLPPGRYFIELKDADAVEITHKGRRIGYSPPGVVVE
jgi:cytoskeletal protein RodZ